MKSRRIIVVASLALLLLLIFAMGAAADTGADATYVTGIQVQNQSADPVTITIKFYSPEGGDPVLTSDPYGIAGNESLGFIVGDEFPDLPADFVGSAVVEANGPVAAILNTNTPGDTGTQADPFIYGAATGVGGGSASGGLEPAMNMYAPYVRKSYYGYTSYVAVQNTANTTATVTVKYKGADGEWVGTAEETESVPAFSTHIFDQGNNTGLPEDFIGSAVISANEPVAVIVNIPNDQEARLESYNGLSSGSTKLYIPKADLEIGNYSSGISIQNVSEVTATMNITFSIGGLEVSKTSDPMGPGQTWVIYMPNEEHTGLPADLTGVTGSAIVTSDQEIVATVSTDNDVNGHDFLYNATNSGAATSTVLFPKFDKGFYNWKGGIQVQNLGETATDLIATFSQPGMADVVIPRESVDPGASEVWFNPEELPDDFAGSVVVTSESGAPISGVYTGRNDNLVGDTVGCYEGIQK